MDDLAAQRRGLLVVALCDGENRECRLRLCPPRRMAGKRAVELDCLGRRSLCELEELGVVGRDAERCRAECKRSESFTPRRRPAVVGRHLYGPLEVLAHPRWVPLGGRQQPAPGFEQPCSQGGRRCRYGSRSSTEPLIGLRHFTQIHQGKRDAARGQELDGSVTLHLRHAVRFDASRHHQVRDHLGSRVQMDAVQQLELLASALALGHQVAHPVGDPANLLEMAGRRADVDHRGVVDVGHGDDRRHHPGPVADPFVDAQRPLEDLPDLPGTGAGLRRVEHRVHGFACGHPSNDLEDAPRVHLLPEPQAQAAEQDDPDLAQRGGQSPVVAQLLRERRGGAIGLLGPVEVRLLGRCAKRLPQRRAKERLSELQVRTQLGRLVAARGRAIAHSPSHLCRSLLVVRQAEGGRTAQLDVELEAGIPHRFGESGELSKALETVRRVARHGICVVAEAEEIAPILRRGDRRKRLLDQAQRLLCGVGLQRRSGGVNRQACRALRVTCRQRVARDHRQSSRRRIPAFQQQVDDRPMNPAAARLRQLRHGEISHLLVGEGVIGR